MRQVRTSSDPLLAVAGLTLILGACSSGPSIPVTTSTAVPVAIAPMTAAAFVEAAASAALYSVRAAELAEQRSSSAEVRRLAAIQRSNGEGIASQLSYAGRRLDLLPDATLSSEHQMMLNALRAAPDFDATYLAQQQSLVPETRRLHQAYATGGGSPTLRPVAELAAELLAEQEAALGAAD